MNTGPYSEVSGTPTVYCCDSPAMRNADRTVRQHRSEQNCGKYRRLPLLSRGRESADAACGVFPIPCQNLPDIGSLEGIEAEGLAELGPAVKTKLSASHATKASARSIGATGSAADAAGVFFLCNRMIATEYLTKHG